MQQGDSGLGSDIKEMQLSSLIPEKKFISFCRQFKPIQFRIMINGRDVNMRGQIENIDGLKIDEICNLFNWIFFLLFIKSNSLKVRLGGLKNLRNQMRTHVLCSTRANDFIDAIFHHGKFSSVIYHA